MKKYKYSFKKDFGGGLGICYKEPIVNEELTEEQIKQYEKYDYKLMKVEVIDEMPTQQ